MSLFRVTTTALNLREAPDRTSAVIEELPRNTRVVKIGESPDAYWFQVRHETAAATREGWASGKFLEELPQSAPARDLSNARFNVQRRRDYIDGILRETESGPASRYDFFRPARQDWDRGHWLHGFDAGGKYFMVGASWTESQARGRLVITVPTREITAAEFSKRFGGSEAATYCNYNVSYCYQAAYGGTNLQDSNGALAGGERTANQIVFLLRSTWRSVTVAEAAAIANAGGFVIAARLNPGGHGHVVFLCEGSHEDQGVGGLHCFHVGGGDPRETPLKGAFAATEGVELFVDEPTYREWFAISDAGLEETMGADPAPDHVDELTTLEPFTIETDLKKRPSILTADHIESLLQAPRRKALAGVGQAVVAASRKYGINAAYIVAHAALESDWGRSNIARKKFNLFGWQAFDNTPFESAGQFPSWAACIDYVMGRINELYLKPGAKYFVRAACLGTGRPGRKFGMNANYATDPEWGAQIADIANRLEREVL